MAQWQEDWARPVAGYQRSNWAVQNGTFGISRQKSTRLGIDVNWLTGKNVPSSGAAKKISHQLPSRVVDLNKNLSWSFLFKLNAGGAIRFWPFCNLPTLLPSDAATFGYQLFITATNALGMNREDLGGGALTFVNPGWASDTNEHLLTLTREVSGANRFWRIYLDYVLLSGPTNEATYGSGSYLGIACDERDMTGPILITS